MDKEIKTPQPEQTNNLQPDQSASTEPTSHRQSKRKTFLYSLLIFIVVVGVTVLVTLWFTSRGGNNISNSAAESTETHTSADDADHTHVDVTKLPLGDGKYSTEPKQGYVYSCQTSFNGGGAFTQGPWIDTSSNTWNLNAKVSVSGSVSWPNASWLATVNSDKRTIASKDIPVGHTTGTFPVASTDEAYNYDRNPNSIKEQSVSFEIPKNPSQLSGPECVGGEVGIATTGVLIFNAFDAGGRDAVATEVQDSCQGHPQEGSYYHYHGYSSCFEDTSADGEHSDLLGYAFDGFGIFGLKGEGGVELASADLDECHGHTHTITWDGQQVEMYHYHMTQDFPYTVSCFRGKPSVKALSSAGAGAGQGQLPPRRP